jgi:hypothetical protein
MDNRKFDEPEDIMEIKSYSDDEDKVYILTEDEKRGAEKRIEASKDDICTLTDEEREAEERREAFIHRTDYSSSILETCHGCADTYQDTYRLVHSDAKTAKKKLSGVYDPVSVIFYI